jgi:four helix bundle protein
VAFKTFEEIPVWQAGRRLVREVYGKTRQVRFRDDRGLCDQIQRAAVSVTSNIAEGHAAPRWI